MTQNSTAATEARRVAANLLINVRRDVVTEALDGDVSPELEERVYHAVREIGFSLEESVDLNIGCP